MKEVYILDVQEDSPTVHPVAFATLKAAQDYVHRWHGAHLDWRMETLFDISVYGWIAEPEQEYLPRYTVTLHHVLQEREDPHESGKVDASDGDAPKGNFRAARGILGPATESAEVTIRRIRGDTLISTAPDGQTLGERLRWLRERKGNTLGCQAFVVGGISLSYLSDLERGRTLPSLATLYKLAAAYNMTASELLRNVVLREEDLE